MLIVSVLYLYGDQIVHHKKKILKVLFKLLYSIFSIFVFNQLYSQGPPPLPWDLGDAPDSYGSAGHQLSELALGSVMDFEYDALPSSDEADGDDNDNLDDEDGVNEDQLDGLNTASENFSIEISYSNQWDHDATVYSWIDFDRNGTFDSDEFTSTPIAKYTSGKAILNWNDLDGRIDIIDGKTYARFRITYEDLSSNESTKWVYSGEIEDYVLVIKGGTLGVDDELLERDLSLYPNPVSEILSVESRFPLKRIEIYNLLGQEVKEVHSNFETINLRDLSKGIYMIKISSENGSTVRKLIKQ